VPNVLCSSCGLTSYAPTPHNAASPCPYCDAELFPAMRSARGPATDHKAADEREADAA
jgi:hypothetical protein